MKKTIILFLTLVLALPSAFAQNEDWARFRTYSEQNASVTVRPKAVLLGDSITELWAKYDPEFFAENNFIGRGISGQTTSQILVRMNPDVVAHRPKYVVILCGINDLAYNAGYAPSVERMLGSIRSMCDIARANKIKPLVCALLPSYRCSWRAEASADMLDRVIEFNSLLKDYAAKERIPYVDYFTLFADEEGKMPKEYSPDTIHPNPAGYEKMEEYLLRFLK